MPWVNNTRTTAGQRSHLVDIIAPAGTVAEDDTRIEANVPAAIVPWPNTAQRGESLGLGGVQGATLYTVSLTYRTDVPSSYVLLERCCTKRRFAITAVVPSDRRDALDLTCVTAG